jgi:hypothetical protein
MTEIFDHEAFFEDYPAAREQAERVCAVAGISLAEAGEWVHDVAEQVATEHPLYPHDSWFGPVGSWSGTVAIIKVDDDRPFAGPLLSQIQNALATGRVIILLARRHTPLARAQARLELLLGGAAAGGVQ